MDQSSMKTDVPSVAADAVLVKSEFDSSSAQVSSDNANSVTAVWKHSHCLLHMRLCVILLT